MFVVTLTFLGIGIWGLTELETKFESSWFLPQESYIAKWERASADYFSNAGEWVRKLYLKIRFLKVRFNFDLVWEYNFSSLKLYNPNILGKHVTVYVTDVNFSANISKIGQFLTEFPTDLTQWIYIMSSLKLYNPNIFRQACYGFRQKSPRVTHWDVTLMPHDGRWRYIFHQLSTTSNSK